MIKSTFCLKVQLFYIYITSQTQLSNFYQKVSFWWISSIFMKFKSYVFKDKLLLLNLSFLVNGSVVFCLYIHISYDKVYFQNALITECFNYHHFLHIVILPHKYYYLVIYWSIYLSIPRINFSKLQITALIDLS